MLSLPIQDLWGIWNTTSLVLVPGPLWSGAVVSRRVSSMDLMELLNHLTVWQQITDVQLNFYIISSIIITSRHQHGYPWPPLTSSLHCILLLAGPQGYIPYWHRAAVCRFLLFVLPLLVHVKGSTGVHYLMSSSLLLRMSGSSNFDSFHDGW